MIFQCDKPFEPKQPLRGYSQRPIAFGNVRIDEILQEAQLLCVRVVLGAHFEHISGDVIFDGNECGAEET